VLITGLGLLATMSTTTRALTTSMYMVALGAGMGLLMQSTQLVAQNSVAQRDVGAASGAVTLFRTLGGSLGVSLLGTLFAQRVQSTFATSGPTAGPAGGAPAGVGGGYVTPGMLNALPAPLREAYQAAITSGVQQVFLWAALIAVLALIAAWVIREVPLRGTEPAESAIIPPDTETAISGTVRRHNGSPLVGTPLTLIDTAGREIAVSRTGSDGSYRLPVPIPGTYLLVAAASGFAPAASRITVGSNPVSSGPVSSHPVSNDSMSSSPVRHDIVLLDLESAAVGLAQRVPVPGPRWRKPGLVVTALAAPILVAAVALWPTSTNGSTTNSAAAPTQGSAVPQSQVPAVPRHEDNPATAGNEQSALLRSTAPSPHTAAVQHRPPATRPSAGNNSAIGGQALVLREATSRWQPAADYPVTARTPSQGLDAPPAQQQTGHTPSVNPTPAPRCPNPAASPAPTAGESSSAPAPQAHGAYQGRGRGEPPCGWHARPANW
ncbi:MAG: carboxypeptidase regulatory-like domain-containing protein, partial [Pseudonocardiaceae bacterium]